MTPKRRRRRLERRCDDLRVIDRLGPAAARQIGQAGNPVGSEPLTPLDHRRARHTPSVRAAPETPAPATASTISARSRCPAETVEDRVQHSNVAAIVIAENKHGRGHGTSSRPHPTDVN